jgi:hypothetical protein
MTLAQGKEHPRPDHPSMRAKNGLPAPGQPRGGGGGMHWQVVRDFLGPGDWSLKIDGQSEGMNRNIFMEFPARTEGTITIGSVLPQYLEHYNTYVDIHRNCYI